MLVSNDFAVRMMGAHTPQIPEDKDDVVDEVVESIFKKIMPFQSFVDISRCKKLSPSTVKYFEAGLSLLYLDISYTRLNRLETICNFCVNLKAINLAGLEMIDKDYKALESLLCVEIVNMRGSNVQNIQSLSQLHCLRSLDLGHTTILNINPLSNKTRLEELLLDHCNVLEFQKNKYFLFQALHSLSNLKLFNYCNSEIAQYSIQIRRTIKSDYHLESVTRREMFFKAIVDNDTKKMLECICNGQDIDMRSTPDDISTFTAIYKERCISKYSSTPFVQCNHANEECRPAGIHLAILFNAYECFQILMDQNVSKSQSVWFGDVAIVDNIIQPVTDANLQITLSGEHATLGYNSSNVYHTKDLINMVFARNMHRITERMFEKKITNWKSICVSINRKLLYLYDSTKVSKRMSQEQLNTRNSFAISNEDEENVEGGGALINIEEGEATKENTEEASGSSKLLKVMKDVTKAVAVTSAMTPVTDLAAMPVKKKRVSMVDSTVVKAPKKLIPERKESKYNWREHPMVKKLTALPIIITEKVPVKNATTSSVSGVTGTRTSASVGSPLKNSVSAPTSNAVVSATRASAGGLRQSWTGQAAAITAAPTITYTTKETSVLGAKSYWLESRKHWATEKAHREAADYCSDDEDTEEGLDTIHHHHKFFNTNPHPNAHKHPHDHRLDHSKAAYDDFKQSIIDLHADEAKKAKLAWEQKLADQKAREAERLRIEEEKRIEFEAYIQNYNVQVDAGSSRPSSASVEVIPTTTSTIVAVPSAVAESKDDESVNSPSPSDSRISSPDNMMRTKSVDEMWSPDTARTKSFDELASPGREAKSMEGEAAANTLATSASAPTFVKPAPLKKQPSMSDRRGTLIRAVSMRVEDRNNKALGIND